MTPRPPLSEVLQRSEVLFDREHLAREITRMGREIDAALAGERAIFAVVMTGALVFAGELALAIGSDLEFEYVHATRYRGATAGGELQWLRRPQLPMDGRIVLLVDDILDEGHTLKAVRDACLGLGARRVLVATLCRKQHDRCVDGIAPDFNGVVVPDAYVYGYGMDYHEQGRNLPAIHALREG
ncbi:MAG TPA: hypoxanthine-guanine phosphoribosyltransferase [Rhodanobacteraceae bacterium]|nr:hypoxanthine-guanine phosphoribosyltransferase [Rhodanobacteraceae bacterium]